MVFVPKLKMGNIFGKKKIKVPDVTERGELNVIVRPRDDTSDSDPRAKLNEFKQIIKDAELKNLDKMREDLKKNPMAFVLNNLVLSIQFFDNFDR